jgi:hypothetical protein
VRNKTSLGIGFGKYMNNTDIAWWSFNGTFMDMYSDDKMQFELDA